ncbi:MAG: lipoprotein [Thiohalomonadales bacterium]|nr:lipoprotein [Thiohalomonadales bacterium]
MRFCIPQFAFIALIIILGMSSMLAGCGKKGPLYLPDQDSKTTLQQR